MTTFHDHFSGHAASYGAFRPTYPPALFAWLAREAPGRRAWDVACGNGQASVALAEVGFAVTATDASAQQIASAIAHPGVRYSVGDATASGLPDGSVHLVTVAQALHWFDFAAFFAEAERVLASGGLLAAWCYELFTIDPAVDAPMLVLYRDIVGADWPPERRHIEAGYRTIPWPRPEIEAPGITMEADWSVDQVLGYLRTWSAVRRYIAREGRDPVDAIEVDLRLAWGPEAVRRVVWPVSLRASRL
ncbi:MAG: class I SAM-dependent methyltransferase [Alphaproteobacteria bacterium]|nr:class I SAM-dependent methyltransferase [Myxococcales bacterium]MCB9668496.1 class I SAM-dependent methyltransferase [Alphaproteobacteria bacterium]MCB9690736.1 class I SAM-dependent methyltransferase [Alphaproteobacteria bacterium]